MNLLVTLVSRAIALLLALLFISTICSAVWMVNMQAAAFKADTYLEPFAREDAYENIVPLVLPAIAHAPDLRTRHENNLLAGRVDFPTLVDNLQPADWDSIAAEIVPADYLQTETEKNATIFFDYAQGERDRLDIIFDSGVIRDNLLGQPGDRMVNRIFTALPTCTESDETQLIQFLADTSIDFPYCKPTDAALQRETFSLLNQVKDDLAADIPDQWDVRQQRAERENLTLDQVDRLYFEELQQPTIITEALYPLAFLMPSGFLALIVILAVRSSKAFFAWIGWSVAAAGLMVLLPLGFIPLTLPTFMAGNNNGEISTFQEEAIRGTLASLVSTFTMPILTQGAIMVAVGFAAVFISVLLNDPDDDLQDIPFAMNPQSTQSVRQINSNDDTHRL